MAIADRMMALVNSALAELAALGHRSVAWAREWLDALTMVPGRILTMEGLEWGLRLLGLLALLTAYLLARSRVAGWVSLAVQGLSGLPSQQGRLTTIVRWAGFAQTLLPTVLVGACGYAGMALLYRSLPEMAWIEIIFRWVLLYWLGRQTLLGLTTRVSRWRPPLVRANPETVALLKRTYARLVPLLMLAPMLARLNRGLFGTVHLATLVGAGLLLMVVVWLIWALGAWRAPAASWVRQGREPEVLVARLADWMARSRWGGSLTPFALGVTVWDRGAEALRAVLDRGGILAYFRSRGLARLAEKEARQQVETKGSELPAAYRDAFPLYPNLTDDDALLVPKPALTGQVIEHFRRWEASRTDSSLVLVGERGCGKTTVIRLVQAALNSSAALEHVIRGKLLTEADLCRQLASGLGLQDAATVEALAPELRALGPAMIVLDEAHNTFLRAVDGQRGLEALVGLINKTSDALFWVLGFNQQAWHFLNHSRRRWGYLRNVMHIPEWSVADIQDLIYRRNEHTGFELAFDEVLLDEKRSDDSGFELIENADAYFRMLAEDSGGNPRIAMSLWLGSLRYMGGERVRVGFYGRPNRKVIDELSDELVFALAAFSHHENLNLEELAEVLNVRVGPAEFAMQYLREANIIGALRMDGRRYAITPLFYHQVHRLLRQKHLI